MTRGQLWLYTFSHEIALTLAQVISFIVTSWTMSNPIAHLAQLYWFSAPCSTEKLSWLNTACGKKNQ